MLTYIPSNTYVMSGVCIVLLPLFVTFNYLTVSSFCK